MKVLLLAGAGSIGLGLLVSGQAQSEAAAQTVFEVASVKPSGPQCVRMSDGGPGSHDPERFSYTSAHLRDLLFVAYGLIDYEQQISGPGWIDTEKYDLAVKIPPGTTKKQFQLMLQNLLADRFKLVVHHETKELPVYELVIGKSGPKLKESAGIPGEHAPPSDYRDRDGFPILPAGSPGFASGFGPGLHSHWTAHQQGMPALADRLSGRLATGRRVVDKTGLTGKYDFTLAYDMERAGDPPADADDGPLPSIFDAVQQQLGLKLVAGKAPFDVVVVDRAEKMPTEN
jgi:uncharacterized protein (TIGR03435 family)